IEQISAVGPENRHEVGNHRVALAPTEHIAEIAAAACRGHGAGGLDHFVPGFWTPGYALLGVFGCIIEEHLGIADIGYANEFSRVVGVATDSERLGKEVIVRATCADSVVVRCQI